MVKDSSAPTSKNNKTAEKNIASTRILFWLESKNKLALTLNIKNK